MAIYGAVSSVVYEAPTWIFVWRLDKTDSDRETEWSQVICFGVLAQTLSTYQPVSVSTTLYVQKSNAMERLEELGRRELLEASPSVKSC